MDNKKISKQVGLDLLDFAWKLLTQWKGLLLFSLVFAIALSSFSYWGAVKDYKKAIEESKKSDAAPDYEVQIESVLSELSIDDRNKVEIAIENDDAIFNMERYLQNSIYLNLDANNVIIANLEFFISNVENNDMTTALYNGYVAAIENAESGGPLYDLFAQEYKDVKASYIGELVRFSDPNKKSDKLDSDYSVLEVYLMLPENIDEEEAANAIKDIVASNHKTLSDEITQHTIECVYSTVNQSVVYDVHNQRHDYSNWITNCKTWQTAYINSLTEEQKVAYESIKAIKNKQYMENDKTQDNEPDLPQAPGFSKKMFVLGAFVGVVLYALLLGIYSLKGNRVYNASVAEYFSNSRLLGELFIEKNYQGIGKLFHSKAISKIRFGGRINNESEIKLITNAVKASCIRDGIEKVSFIHFEHNTELTEEYINTIKKGISCAGVKTESISEIETKDEMAMSSLESAVLVVDSNTKINKVEKCVECCSNYNVDVLGTIYINII